MGYLAQRKKYMRTNFVLKSLLLLLTVFSVAAFGDNALGYFCNNWRFQFYLLSAALAVYALCSRFFLYAFWAAMVLLVNFFVISSVVSVVLADGGEAVGSGAKLMYQDNTTSFLDVFETFASKKADLLAVVNPEEKDVSPQGLVPAGSFLSAGGKGGSFMVSATHPQAAGKIKLAPGNSAVFVRCAHQGKNYVFLALSTEGLSRRRQEQALQAVSAFISAEDDPVIVFGNFGMPAWDRLFTKFLADSGLEVKNTLFADVLGVFTPPTEYVIGYRNLEFSGIRRLPRRGNPSAPLLFYLKI